MNLFETYRDRTVVVDPANGRTWQFTPEDIYRLSGFTFQIGEALRVTTGAADLGIGYSADGVVWASITPRAEGLISSPSLPVSETISNVWLRFNPNVVNRLLPPETVFAGGDTNRYGQLRSMAATKLRWSWQSNGNPMIPPLDAMTVVVDTREGHRRFFVVDTAAGTADYAAVFDERHDLVLRGQWPGYRRGSAQAVAVSGRYACVAAESLQVIDLGDPAAPRLAGTYGTRLLTAVACAGAYACLAGPLGFEVIDLSDPRAPRSLSVTAKSGQPQDLQVVGNYAYLVSERLEGRGAGLVIIDISHPANPARVGGYETADGVYGVAIAGHYAYLAASKSGLVVVDIAQPDKPRLVATLNKNNNARGIVVSGNYAYVADGAAGLRVIDITDPAQPVEKGVCKTPGQAIGVAIAGNHVYIADGDYGLQVVEVTNPSEPKLVGAYDTPGQASRVALFAGQVLVADGAGGLRIIDVADPAAPKPVGAYRTGGETRNLVVSRQYAFLGEGDGWMRVIDVRQPAQPRQVAEYETQGVLTAPQIAISGNYAYVSGANPSLKTLDISDPSQPRWLGGYQVQEPVLCLAAAADQVYAGNFEGVQVLEVKDPANPRLVAKVTAQRSPQALAVSDRFAYAVWLWDGMQVIDLAQPDQPKVVGELMLTNWWASGAAIAGDHLYVSDSFHGLRIIDVAQPAQPREVARCDWGLPLNGVAVYGTYAYAAGFGLWVVDIGNPVNPRVIASQAEVSGWAVVCADNLVYVAAGLDGLLIYEAFQPPRMASLRWEPSFKCAADGSHLFLEGVPGQTLQLERSYDLTTWEPWQTLTATGGRQEFVDPLPVSRPCRFYRAVSPY